MSFLILTSKSEATDRIYSHPNEKQTVQDEHLIMWASLLEEGKPRIITRQSGSIRDFFDNTFIKG